MSAIHRPQPLSVVEAAASLHASEAYVRRLLITERLFGIKVGPVWVIYPEDLESFSRLRRPRGRPRKGQARPRGEADRRERINSERAAMGTDDALLTSRESPRVLPDSLDAAAG